MPKAAWTVTAVSVVAIAVLLIVSLSSGSGSETSQDAFTIRANRLCRVAARKIAAERRQHEGSPRQGSFGPFAESLAWIVGNVRAKIVKLTMPPDRAASIVEMETAMLESEDRLIKVAREPDQEVTAVRNANAASDHVKQAASSAGVSQCGRLSLGL